MGFDWCVSISLAYCIPIKLDEKVSLWYMLKRLAEYEPGYTKRAHEAILTPPPRRRQRNAASHKAASQPKHSHRFLRQLPCE